MHFSLLIPDLTLVLDMASKESSTADELDELCVRVLELMNENIKCKLDLERALKSGCMDLAKTRYILGNTNSVSATKIPTEDISASSTIVSTNEGEKVSFELKKEVTKLDPLKWFGILVPSNLRQSQAWFSKTLDLSVQSANIGNDLSAVMDQYKTLLQKKELQTVSDVSD